MSAGDDPRGPWSKRRWFAVLILAAGIAIVGTHGAGDTFAVGGFSAHNVYKTSTITSGALKPPKTLTARAIGDSVELTWALQATSNKTKQVVSVSHTGTAIPCTSSLTFTSLTANLPTSATTYTTPSMTLTPTGTTKPGDWYCYQVASAYGTSWTQPAFAATQAGFVATKVSVSTSLSTSGTSVSIDTATVTVTFNQKIATTATQLKTAVNSVCAIKSTTIPELLLGDESATSTTKCKTSDNVSFGRLRSSVALSAKKYYTTVAYSVENTTTNHLYSIALTFKAKTASSLAAFSGTPTWTFVPGTTKTEVLKSKTGSLTVCMTNSRTSGLCQPAVTSKTL